MPKLEGTVDLTFVHADDWVAVYNFGDLMYQGHSLTPEMFLELLGIDYERKWADEWAVNHGWFPDHLEEIGHFDDL